MRNTELDPRKLSSHNLYFLVLKLIFERLLGPENLHAVIEKLDLDLAYLFCQSLQLVRVI